jgi:pyridoxine 5-phosphate synthase
MYLKKEKKMKRLGVNIDHIATLRQQRKEGTPDLIQAAHVVLGAGANGITIHLREDRRHIQDEDVFSLKKITPHLNLEMGATEEMVRIAKKTRPAACCLVPEKREELTTEGGLNLTDNFHSIKPKIRELKKSGIPVTVFIDPDEKQIDAAVSLDCDGIEIHTGTYSRLSGVLRDKELFCIIKAADYAKEKGLNVHAGHGLDIYNIKDIISIASIEELNIGFSIVSRSLFIGLDNAVKEIKSLII